MQPTLKKIDSSVPEIFHCMDVDEPHFFPLWHYHPQCEIILIEEAEGTLYIGDGVDQFQPGDVFMLGANIPHLLRNFPEYFLFDSTLKARAKVIYFQEGFLGSEFMDLNEVLPIKNLLRICRNGMIIKGESKKNIAQKIRQLLDCSGIDRVLKFIGLLNNLATNTEYSLLSNEGFKLSYDEKEVDRLNDVSDFLLNNFTRTIRLKEVAELVHMSETAFCRYFKEKTNKTLISFLNEIRIGYASKLLIEKQHLNVSQICYKTGFNNLTNFNIQFKKIKKCSPLEYRLSYSLAGNHKKLN